MFALMFCVVGAYAENDNAATSREYVDTGLATKQPIVPGAGNNVVMTFDSTATNGIGTKNIYDPSGSYAAQQNALVTAATANAAMQMAINGEFVCDEWSTIDPTDCWLWKLKEPVAPSRNLFDISNIPTTYVNGGFGIINNGDGTLSVIRESSNSAQSTHKKLSELAPGLVVGSTYTLTLNTTEDELYRQIYLDEPAKLHWRSGQNQTITQDMLDSKALFYNAHIDTPAIISHIQIEPGTVATPYQPYGQNTYLPQNVQ